MTAKDKETSDFSVIVDIFENSLCISCGDGSFKDRIVVVISEDKDF